MAKDDELRRVGRAVAARRGELGMTQQQLADTANVDLKTVYNLESGARWPIAKTRAAIAAALGWDTSALAAILSGTLPAMDTASPPHPDREWTPPFSTPEELLAAAPYTNRIWERWGTLRAKGITDPAGEDMFPGTDDAGTWDRLSARPLPYRVWMVATIQAADAERERWAGTG